MSQTPDVESAPSTPDPRSLFAALLVLGALLAAAMWPTWSLVPQFGGDPSWQLGMSWGLDLGLQWGPDVVFTFGPLGFMDFPMAFSRPQVLAASMVHVLSAIAALVFAYDLARRHAGLSRTITILVAVMAAGLGLYLTGAIFTALIFGSLAILRSRSWLVVVVVGVGLGVLGQQKLSEAILVLGFATLCALGGLGVRGLLGLAAVTGLTWLGIWLGTGQSIENILAWVDGAVEMSVGYSAALGLEQPGTVWHYVVAVLLVVLILATAWWATAPLGGRRRYTLLAAVAWALWLTWNAAFTRHDLHALRFFEETIVITLGLVLVGGRGPSLRAGLVAIAIAYLSMNALAPQFLGPIDRSNSLASLDRTLAVLSSSEVRDQLLRDTRARLTERYAITPELRAALGDRPTVADPSPISALWAVGGPDMLPFPVLQLITSYTDELDRITGEHIADQPRQVLRNVPYGAVDGRYPPWDSPSYQIQLYCGYEMVFETPRWQVLRPSDADVCGEPSDATVVELEADEQAQVPYRSGQMTVVTIEPEVGTLERLRSFLFKPDPTYVQYGPDTWRYAYGKVANRLMLNAPVWHPSYPTQPLTPFETISIDRPATMTFEFVTVGPEAPGDPSTGTGTGTGDINDLVVAAAGSIPPGATPPTVFFSNDVAILAPDEQCIRVDPEGVDPYIALAVPSGSGLHVSSEAGGATQVFVEVEGSYTEAQSRRFSATSRPYQLSMLPREDAATSAIRIDPPAEGLTTICLVPAQTENS